MLTVIILLILCAIAIMILGKKTHDTQKISVTNEFDISPNSKITQSSNNQSNQSGVGEEGAVNGAVLTLTVVSQVANNESAISNRPLVSLTKYPMSIENRTCGCPDWQKTRSIYYRGEPQRLCKHLIKAIVQAGLQNEYGSEANKLIGASEKRIGYYLDERDEKERGAREKQEIIRGYFGAKAKIMHEPAIKKAYGEVYVYNLSMVAARTKGGPATLYVPKVDYYRWRFEALARMGTARRGSQIAPKDIIEALTMQELRALVSTKLNGAKIRTKNEGREKLASLNLTTRQLIPAEHDIDDYFRIEPPNLEWVLKTFG